MRERQHDGIFVEFDDADLSPIHRQAWNRARFDLRQMPFSVHVKKTDSAGEDGDFEGKTRLLEEVDGFVGQILGLDPDVLVVTGDHSTPSIMKSHSWHPVPLLISSPWVNPLGAPQGFSEKQCATGDLGQIPATAVMALALAHARRLGKFGA